MKSIITIALLVFLNTGMVFAGDKLAIPDGQKLHDGKCQKCHNTEVYSRLDRTINSLELLTSRVKGCVKNAVKADWSDSEINSVVEYLNKEFYKF